MTDERGSPRFVSDRPPVSGEPSRPWGSADAALHDAVWTMAASARIPVERREEFAQMGMALIRSELAIRRLAIEAEASTGAALDASRVIRLALDYFLPLITRDFAGQDAQARIDARMTASKVLHAEYARLAEQEGEAR